LIFIYIINSRFCLKEICIQNIAFCMIAIL
jgi:hypothetical protein